MSDVIFCIDLQKTRQKKIIILAEDLSESGVPPEQASPNPTQQITVSPHRRSQAILSAIIRETLQTREVGDEGLELLPFSTGSSAICVERDAESDAYLHEKAVIEQFKLLQPLFSSNLKQALISELVGSLVER